MKFFQDLMNAPSQSRFSKATLQLTAWYLAILMVISLFFSIALYHTSSQALGDTTRVQVSRFEGLPFAGPEVIMEMQAELEKARHNLLMNLMVQNILVLVAGGALSFFFARRTLRPIEQAMVTQARFTADASHELRTPLTAMKSEIEVALRDTKPTTKEMRHVLESNLEEIDKLEALSTSLLKLARYDEDIDEIALESVALRPFVERCVARFKATAQQRDITLTTHLKEVTGEIDKPSIKELLSILIDNALKYSQEGGTVSVSLGEQKGQAQLTIADTGIGIKSQDLPHLFERFYRADTSRSGQHVTGHGLGLAIAKSIVDRHNGTVEVTSTPGKGTTFTVKLPLQQRRSSLPL